MSLLLAIGWLDYVTGYELGLFIFYSLPVGIVAWRLGRWPGILLAMAAGVTWLLADMAAGDKFSSSFFLYWTASLHCGGFLINAITLSKIKETLDSRHRLADELAQAQAEIRRLQGSASPAAGGESCSECGQARPHTDLAK